MLSRQSCNLIGAADLLGIRQDENGRCAFPDHGTEESFIVIRMEKFLDADAALLYVTRKLSHAEICSF